jgi:YgiT-type zinc finger domain-containing protein
MKCVICHGDNIEAKSIQEILTIGNDVVYVPLKVLVCNSCGERYYDRRAMHLLETAEKRLKEGKVHLEEVGKVLLYA